MNLKEFYELSKRLYSLSITNNNDPEQINIGIEVKRIGAIGGTPLVNIKSINFGFDWDHGKLIIHPEKLLKEANIDEVKLLQKKFDNLG